MKNIKLGFVNIKKYANISHEITDKENIHFFSNFFKISKLPEIKEIGIEKWFTLIELFKLKYVFLNEGVSSDVFEYRTKHNISVFFIVWPYVFEPWKEEYEKLIEFVNQKDIILTFSNYLKEEFDKLSSNLPLYNFPVPIDIEFYKNNKLELKKCLNLLFCGRIIERKGLDLLIDAITDLQIDFHLNIIGPIKDSKVHSPNQNIDKNYYNLITKKIQQNNLENKITFLGSLVQNNKLKRDIFLQSDILIHPTTDPGETFGKVIVEGFASKTAVITSNWQGVNELVKPNINGFLINTSLSKEEKILKIKKYILKLSDATVLEQIKQNNVKKARKYDYKHLLRKLNLKMQANLEELNFQSSEKKYFMKISNVCNNNCLFCEAIDMKSYEKRTIDEIKREIDYILKLEYTTVILPCNADCDPNFSKIINYVKQNNLNIELFSNGRIVSYEQFCEKLKNKISKIIFIENNNSTKHDTITKVDNSHKQLSKGIKNCFELNIPFEHKQFQWASFEPEVITIPKEVIIEITSECNFSCIGCFNKQTFAQYSRTVALNKSDIIKIIDSITSIGIPRIRFSGGEPFLHKDLPELIKYAKSKNLEVYINTNAILMTKALVDEIEDYVDNVLISFNGFDSNSEYNWTQTKNGFESKIDGSKLLIQSSIPIVRTGTIATKDNIENLDKIYELITKIGFQNWEVYRPIDSYSIMNEKDIASLWKKLVNINFKNQDLVTISNSIPFCAYDMEKMNLICVGGIADDGHSRLIIDPRGFVKPHYFSEINLGIGENILQIWNNHILKKIRNLDFVSYKCKNCKFLKKCKGGSLFIKHSTNLLQDPLVRN